MTTKAVEHERDSAQEFLLNPCGETFAPLFRQFCPKLTRYYRFRCCSTAVAEELTQEVMLTVYQRASQLRQQENFRGWIFAIARNVLLSARLESHVVNSARCSRLSANLRRWDRVVAAEATQLSQVFNVDESAVEQMLEEALERVRESEPSQMQTTPVSRSAVEGTLLLRLLLAPLCGPVTARNAIRVAAERSSELREPWLRKPTGGSSSRTCGARWPFRNFRVTERVTAQFRTEAFGATNTPQFSNPGANASSPTRNPDGTIRALNGFGEITGASGERQLRFALKVFF